MTESEIFTMDGGKCIARVRGFNPFFCDKYDITKHPMYQSLLDAHTDDEDGGKKYTFDIAAFTRGIRKRNKAVVSGDTAVEVFESKTENK